MNRSNLAVFSILGVLLLDQIIKFYIKLHFSLGEEVSIFGHSQWAKLHFTENKGMAFGMELGGIYGKIILTVFRLVAAGLLVWWLRSLVRNKAPKGLIFSISLIFAGAMGNIIDSTIYGVIFSESTYHKVATLFPLGGGYANFLTGSVVDMFYFPICAPCNLFGFNIHFFQPIFNLADASITMGVTSIVLFHRSFFKEHSEELNTTHSNQLETKSSIETNPIIERTEE